MLVEIIDKEISFVENAALVSAGAKKMGITPKQWLTRAIMTYYLEG
jgi:hypothetical protein